MMQSSGETCRETENSCLFHREEERDECVGCDESLPPSCPGSSRASTSLTRTRGATWMAGTSPAMTRGAGDFPLHFCLGLCVPAFALATTAVDAGLPVPLVHARVLETESLRLLVIGEQLGVAAPGDDGLQRLVGIFLRHVVFQLVAETRGRRGVGGALVEHALDQAHHRHEGDEMLGEQLLARIGLEMGEALARLGEHEVAVLELREMQ